MEEAIRILSPLVGIVFLVSGIGKSIATYEFSQILAQYGFDTLQFLAPLIIVFEIAAGLLLFLDIRLKPTSLLSLCFVAALSLAYLYGYFFLDITDCGCFGHFSFMNMSPFFTFVRNVVLMGVLLCIFMKSDNLCRLADRNEIAIIACILCAVCFVTGYTFVEHRSDNTQYVDVNTEVKNTVLSELLMFSEDTTYFVFVFSYSCPHCYNSIENLKQYESMGVADRVIALSVASDSVTMEKFNDLFKPDFQIKNYHPAQLFRLTNRFPVSYYIENNTVKMEIRGLLPCGYLLRDQLNAVF